MKKFFLWLSIFCLILCGSAGTPEAAIILEDDREEVIVNPDGTSTTVDQCVYRIVNHYGVQKMRELNLHYNSDYGSLQVTHLALVKPDGRRLVLDHAGLSTIATESSQLSSSIFDPAQKILSVSVPGLEAGDILEVTTLEKQTKSRLPGHWSDIAVLQADFPITRYEYIVNMPSALPLAGICVKDEVPGTLTRSTVRKNDRIIYTFTAENVPQAIPEPAMPPMYTCTQRVLVSTVKSWEDISRWYDRLCTPHLEKVNDAMRQKTAELIDGKRNEAEKIMALFQFVSQQIRYTGVTDEESAPGYEPHDVDRTFNQRHGVCRDKAALLTAMLRLAGFKAFPTLFMAGSPKDSEVANIYFNHAIVAVETAAGQYQLMDPTDESTTELFPAYLAGFPYLPARPEGDTLRIADPVKAEKNLLDIHTVMGKDSAVTELKFSGFYDNIYRSAISQWQPEDTRTFFAAKLRNILPGAELTALKILPENIRDMSRELAITLSYTLPPEAAGNRPAPITLPRCAVELGMLNSFYRGTALQKRRFPLQAMPRAIREKITLPAADGTKYELPADISVREAGLCRLDRKTFLKSGQICEEFFFALDSMLVKPADYQLLRSAATTLQRGSKVLPMAEKTVSGTASQANAEILKYDRHYNIIDQHTWDISVNSVTRILNYAGLKEHANTTIEYVESDGVPQIKASVTDSRSNVHQLSAKDIRIMDDPATAAAPRYAKRKLAIITFPGVDAGSIIDLTVTRRISRQAAFYTELLTANSLPVKEAGLIIEHPAKMPLKISGIPQGIQDSATMGGKRIIRRYTLKNSPKIPEEPGQPAYSVFIPALKISAADNTGLFRRFTGMAQQKAAALSPEIAETARKIASERKFNPEELIHAVEQYVYKHIREVDLPLHKMLPEDFSDPQVTLRDGYGSNVDRGILIAALLQSLGMKCEFIPFSETVSASGQLDDLQNFPRNIYSGMLVRVNGICVNDSGLYAPAGTLHHQENFILSEHGVKHFPAQQTANRRSIRCTVTVASDLSARIDLTASPEGIFLERLRKKFASFTPQTSRQFFEKYASSIAPQAEILASRFENDQLFLSLRIPDFAIRSGKFIILPLPDHQQLTAAAAIPPEKRQTPFLSRSQEDLLLEYIISVPENFTVVKPETANVSIENIFFRSGYLNAGGKHILEFSWQETPSLLTPEKFEYLREINRMINHFSTKNILFIME